MRLRVPGFGPGSGSGSGSGLDGDGFCADEEGGGGRREGGIFCFSFLQAARRLEEALKNLKKTRRRGGRREGGIVRKEVAEDGIRKNEF